MYKRKYYENKIRKYINSPVVKVITGLRRSGKTYFLQSIKRILQEDYNIQKKNIIFINTEFLHFKDLKTYIDLDEYIKNKIRNISGKIYVLIDEIQDISEWEKVIRSYQAQENFEFFITGSNSTLLSGELSSFLTGRFVEFKIYPLSFLEFLQFKNIDKKKSTDNDFKNYIKYGGLPGIHSLFWDDEVIYNYLQNVFHSILFKDVVSRYKIKNPALLENIFYFLCENIGNIVSTSKIINFCKKEKISISINTLRDYLLYFQNVFLLQKLKRYDIKGKKVLELYEKYYVSDLGIRSYFLGFEEKDIGRVLENIVFIELQRRGWSVFIGKYNDFEIDFIVEKQGKKEYFQVCYLLSDEKIIEREFRGLKNIKDNYPKCVLSMDTFWANEKDGIERKNIIEWLLEE